MTSEFHPSGCAQAQAYDWCKASAELPERKRMKRLNQRLLTFQILEGCFPLYKILQFLSPSFPAHLIFSCHRY
uniref:FYN binding protein 1 n=1 Tax=Molossus molossus TaxID=27622 RepID=A0A7J8IY08_MOLMO|nr:FYN binding protein 1 [Molossus molossus]